MAETINQQILNRLFGLVGVHVASRSSGGYVLAALISCALILGIVAAAAMFFIWMERKVAGRIQDRLGPTRVGGQFGWLQSLADGIKLLAKEDVMPREADALLFRLAPYISFAASFTAYLALPFSDGWVAQHINTAVFFILAVLGLEVFGVILAGYASGSKWSLFGAMRESAQVVSYEVPAGPVRRGPRVSLRDHEPGHDRQHAGGAVHQLAGVPRSVHVRRILGLFHLRRGQREPRAVRSGRSGKRAGGRLPHRVFRYAVELLLHGRVRFDGAGERTGGDPVLRRMERSAARFSHWLGWSDAGGVLGYLADLAGAANFLFKAVIGVTVMIWVRWTLPRLRIDQVMTVCLKYCTPLAAICFIGALAWQTGLLGLLDAPLWSPNELFARKHRGEYREHWVLDLEANQATEPAD